MAKPISHALGMLFVEWQYGESSPEIRYLRRAIRKGAWNGPVNAWTEHIAVPLAMREAARTNHHGDKRAALRELAKIPVVSKISLDTILQQSVIHVRDLLKHLNETTYYKRSIVEQLMKQDGVKVKHPDETLTNEKARYYLTRSNFCNEPSADGLIRGGWVVPDVFSAAA